MLVKDLAQRVAYLKDRNIYTLFNTNGTLFTEANGRALIDAGLDELRVSLDAADSAVYQMVRGKDFFAKIVENVKRFTRLQRELNAPRPRVSLWLTGLRETVDQLPAFVRLAHEVGVPEVYLQRLVFFEEPANEASLARAESALFEHTTAREEALIREAEAVAQELGITFSASGAVDPGESIRMQRTDNPVVPLPPPLVADVHHRQRPRPALLHRALLDEGLRQLHPRRRHAIHPARDLERPRVPALPRRPAHQRPTPRLRQLRPPLEPVIIPRRPSHQAALHCARRVSPRWQCRYRHRQSALQSVLGRPAVRKLFTTIADKRIVDMEPLKADLSRSQISTRCNRPISSMWEDSG